jgi:hypothetical protein
MRLLLLIVTAAVLLMQGCDQSASADSAADHHHGMHHPPVAPMQAAEKEQLPPFIKLGSEPKTVEILLVAAYNDTNGGMNFNGKTRGEATFSVPLGWKVVATFLNRSAVPHSAIVVDTDKTKEFKMGDPIFKNASTPKPDIGTPAGEKLTFTFTPDERGKYAIACGFPTHALAGHWIYLLVTDDTKKPTYKVGDEVIEAK